MWEQGFSSNCMFYKYTIMNLSWWSPDSLKEWHFDFEENILNKNVIVTSKT